MYLHLKINILKKIFNEYKYRNILKLSLRILDYAKSRSIDL